MKKRSIVLLLSMLLLLMLAGCTGEDAPVETTPSPTPFVTPSPTPEPIVIVSTFTEEDIASAEAFGKEYIEAWKKEDWCISLTLNESKYNPELTDFHTARYVNCKPEWTPEYMAENFIVVTVKYECKLDHNLIFYPDGKCYIDLFVTRANADAPWESWDSTGIHEMT